MKSATDLVKEEMDNGATVIEIRSRGRLPWSPKSSEKEGTPLNEFVVSFLLVTLTVAMIILGVAVLIGYHRFMENHAKNS